VSFGRTGVGGYSDAPITLAVPHMKSAFTAAVVVTLLTALASGCATDDATAPASDVPRAQRAEAVTGSRIPNKTAMPAQSDVEREKTVERMKELQKTSTPVQTQPF
jgi:hypothetical protein